MKKRIILGGIVAAFLLVSIPSISAVEYQEITGQKNDIQTIMDNVSALQIEQLPLWLQILLGVIIGLITGSLAKALELSPLTVTIFYFLVYLVTALLNHTGCSSCS